MGRDGTLPDGCTRTPCTDGEQPWGVWSRTGVPLTCWYPSGHVVRVCQEGSDGSAVEMGISLASATTRALLWAPRRGGRDWIKSVADCRDLCVFS